MWGFAISMALDDDNDGPELAQAHFWSPPEFWEFIEKMNMVDDYLLHPTAINADKALARKFRTEVINLIDDIFKINQTDISLLFEGFSPGGTWSKLMGPEEKKLGEDIYSICQRWKNCKMY